jgi:Ca2+:H+ antiporter
MSSRGDGVVSSEKGVSKVNSHERLPTHEGELPGGGGSAKRKRFRIKAAGESGRRGLHPLHFFRIIFRSSSLVSSAVNFLWPVVPAAIAVRYALPDSHLPIFILAYLAMVPCANLIGFAGQELARKVPHVFGVLTETT